MIDKIDSIMEEIKGTLKVEDHCVFESDVKPSELKGRLEYAAYLIRGDEVFKVVVAEMSLYNMKEFSNTPEFPRHIRQCMDKLAVKAGYKQSILNNDKFDKDVTCDSED